MIWIDAATPKYALFFSLMIESLRKRGHNDILVTTRCAPNYTEAKEILELHKIPHIVLGTHGGANVLDKFKARIQKQNELLELFKDKMPSVLLSGSVADSVQFAFGCGIPVVNFSDTPAYDEVGYYGIPRNLAIVARLTMPFSTLCFYPFVLPKELILHFALQESQIMPYPFIDVALWINAIRKESKNDFRIRYGLDTTKPTILMREEEYKAHYVKEKLPIIYDVIPLLKQEFDANIVILPRYEIDKLKCDFSDIATILEDKLKPEEFYPFIDLFIGGGGTMNLEAVCYGIPTISTRSLWLIHDQYLVKNKLMFHTSDCKEILKIAKEWLGKRIEAKKYFAKGECSFNAIIDTIEARILKAQKC